MARYNLPKRRKNDRSLCGNPPEEKYRDKKREPATSDKESDEEVIDIDEENFIIKDYSSVHAKPLP